MKVKDQLGCEEPRCKDIWLSGGGTFSRFWRLVFNSAQNEQPALAGMRLYGFLQYTPTRGAAVLWAMASRRAKMESAGSSGCLIPPPPTRPCPNGGQTQGWLGWDDATNKMEWTLDHGKNKIGLYDTSSFSFPLNRWVHVAGDT